MLWLSGLILADDYILSVYTTEVNSVLRFARSDWFVELVHSFVEVSREFLNIRGGGTLDIISVVYAQAIIHPRVMQ